MAHTKIILPSDYCLGESATNMIKLGSRGLRGNDLGSFIKRSNVKLANKLNKLAFYKGEVPIHLIALGSTEYYGPNRNGDGFTEETCRTCHPTFVKYGRFYRNHVNKDPAKSYGIIKESFYNEDMHRIELIVALNGTKEAAERNKGLVADLELEKIASGKDIAVSMSARVAYDVCQVCFKQAKTRDEYCTEDDCPGGGCRNNLCKVAEDGTITYVDNPNPKWFDISNVFRPADRIAYVFGKVKV